MLITNMVKYSCAIFTAFLIILPSTLHTECNDNQKKSFSAFLDSEQIKNTKLINSGALLPCEIYLCNQAHDYIVELKTNDGLLQERCTAALNFCMDEDRKDVSININKFKVSTEEEKKTFPDCDSTTKIDFKSSKCYKLINGLF
jgi:hypothetical protein